VLGFSGRCAECRSSDPNCPPAQLGLCVKHRRSVSPSACVPCPCRSVSSARPSAEPGLPLPCPFFAWRVQSFSPALARHPDAGRPWSLFWSAAGLQSVAAVGLVVVHSIAEHAEFLAPVCVPGFVCAAVFLGQQLLRPAPGVVFLSVCFLQFHLCCGLIYCRVKPVLFLSCQIKKLEVL
jgi:hypothetical protein